MINKHHTDCSSCFLLMMFSLLLIQNANALGNHPESSTCQADTPWYTVCTSSVHSLEGWTGNCFKTQIEAEQEALQHSNNVHHGNTRWTGVRAPISYK